MSIGENIKHIRNRKGLSLKKLSELSGVGKSTLSELENGININPTRGTLDKIAQALEIPTSLLIGSDESISAVVDKLARIAEFNGDIADVPDAEKRDMLKDMLIQEPALYYLIDEKTRESLMMREDPVPYGSLQSGELLKLVEQFLNNSTIDLETKTLFVKSVMDVYSKLLGG